jgi:predicted nucleotidyltransferase
MRTAPPDLLDTLFGAYRQRVLALLLQRPDESFHVRELARRTGVPSGSLHRELALLSRIELLRRERVGNQVHYRANTASPVFEELAAIFVKTVGLADLLQKALAPLRSRVQLAFVFGSIARKEARARSDVDLLVIGTVSFVDVVKALVDAAGALGREVNPVVMTPEAVREKIAANDPFLQRVLSEPKVFVKGQNDDLGKLVEDRPARPSRGKRRRGAASA